MIAYTAVCGAFLSLAKLGFQLAQNRRFFDIGFCSLKLECKNVLIRRGLIHLAKLELLHDANDEFELDVIDLQS